MKRVGEDTRSFAAILHRRAEQRRNIAQSSQADPDTRVLAAEISGDLRQEILEIIRDAAQAGARQVAEYCRDAVPALSVTVTNSLLEYP